MSLRQAFLVDVLFKNGGKVKMDVLEFLQAHPRWGIYGTTQIRVAVAVDAYLRPQPMDDEIKTACRKAIAKHFHRTVEGMAKLEGK